MNILYILSNRLPTEKAQGYQSIKMIEAFSENNIVSAFYPNRKNSDEMKRVSDIFEYYSIKKKFSLKKISCLDLSLLKKLKLYRLWFFIYSISYVLYSLLSFFKIRKEIDVIYSRSIFAVYFFSIFYKIKIVYEIHTFPRKKRSFRFKVAKRADKVIVITNKLKKLYVEAGIEEQKILVEPDAVDLEQFDIKLSKNEARKKLNISESIKIASFIGNFHTMEMEKGIPDIIESAKYLLDEFKELFFYFVGGPIEREAKYRKIIEENNLSQERFLFFKRQPVKDIPIWLKASDILLMPHPKNVFYSYYVSPLKMFEYMASKRPIVGSKLPAIEEILKDRENALLGIPDNPKSIADNIRNLLIDDRLSFDLANNAYKKVKDYTWEKRAKRIVDFIKL